MPGGEGLGAAGGKSGARLNSRQPAGAELSGSSAGLPGRLSGCPPAPLSLPTQDLAGSERSDKTGAQGQTAAEGNQINKSLSVRGQRACGVPKGRQERAPVERQGQQQAAPSSTGVGLFCPAPALPQALGNVVNSLTDPKGSKGHIPYR